jgi:hypothetical protein
MSAAGAVPAKGRLAPRPGETKRSATRRFWDKKIWPNTLFYKLIIQHDFTQVHPGARGPAFSGKKPPRALPVPPGKPGPVPFPRRLDPPPGPPDRESGPSGGESGPPGRKSGPPRLRIGPAGSPEARPAPLPATTAGLVEGRKAARGGPPSPAGGSGAAGMFA